MKKLFYFLGFLLATFSWQVSAQAVEDNFDSYTSGSSPTGWTKYQTGTDDPGFIVTNLKSNSAPNSLFHKDDDLAAESTSWIVAPEYTTTGNDMLEFYYMQQYTASYYNYSGVWYSTTGNDPTQNPSEWTQIAEFNDTDQPYSDNKWTKYRLFFSIASGTKIYVAFKYTGDYSHRFYVDDFKIKVKPPYFEPEFDLSLTNVDCSISKFSVKVNVTNLGGADSVTVTDDQGNPSQQISDTGTLTFGPYNTGTNVNFTVTNDNDNSYNATSAITYTCPTNNDHCYTADDLTVYDIGAGAGNEITINSDDYTDSGKHTTCDDYGTNKDMWFKVTVPAGETGFKVIYSGDKADKVESAIWDSCEGTQIDCYDYSTDKFRVFQHLTAGTTYYLQLWLDSPTNDGSFKVVVEKLTPAPNCAENPNPANGATGVALTIPLSRPKLTFDWSYSTSGATPDKYKIYIGTTPGTYSISGTLLASTHPIGLLGAEENTTYYWKIVPIAAQVEATGCPEWSLTTGSGDLPPPVANTDCSGAVALSVDPNTCTTQTVADNNYALSSDVPAPSCGFYGGGDLWFSITVPDSGDVNIKTSEFSGSNVTDTGMAIYSGTCGSLTEIECNDDIDTWGGEFFSKIELSGRTPGEVLYVRVWTYKNSKFGKFNICAWDPTVSVADNQIEGLKFYPSPVNHTLNISAKDNIESVSIFNVTGQEVLHITPNATETKVNMRPLQNGIYFVKAQVNGKLTAFKVVKK